MKIPKLFFGTTEAVRRESRKLVTQMLRGRSLEEILATAEMLDADDYPDAFIWLDRAWAGIGGTTPQFPLVLLGDAILGDKRLSFDQINQMRPETVAYLSRSAWGAVVLNCCQSYGWLQGLPFPRHLPARDSYVAVVRSTVAFWDEYTALGERFFTGGYAGKTFAEVTTLCVHVLARCGVDLDYFRIDDPGRVGRRLYDIPSACMSQDVLRRLEVDDDLWQQVCASSRTIGVGAV